LAGWAGDGFSSSMFRSGCWRFVSPDSRCRGRNYQCSPIGPGWLRHDLTRTRIVASGLVSWAHGDATAPLSLLVSLLLLAAFIWHALRHPATALIDPRLFRGPVFRAAASTQFLSNALNFGARCCCRCGSRRCARRRRAHRPDAFSDGAGSVLRTADHGRLSERFGARTISGAARHYHASERFHLSSRPRRRRSAFWRPLCSCAGLATARSRSPRPRRPMLRCRENPSATRRHPSTFASDSGDRRARPDWRYSCNTHCRTRQRRCRHISGLFSPWPRSRHLGF